MATDNKSIIGRAEQIDLMDLALQAVPAKVDTGADSSSIWVSSAQQHEDGLHCIFFGQGSEYYTGQTIIFATGYKLTRVANSFGQKELRYKLKLRIKVKGRLVRATFTLSDRSTKTYPILLGRRLLQGKFIVDVSSGQALKSIERQKSKNLAQELSQLQKGGEAA